MNQITSKLSEARSRLYRRRCLQVNTRVKALDEIYKIHRLLHRSDLKISENSRPKLFKMNTSTSINFSTLPKL